MLTVREVAARLRVSEGCVYQLVAQHRIRHLRVGVGRGTIRIREQDLDAYLEECRVEEPAVGISLKHIRLGQSGR